MRDKLITMVRKALLREQQIDSRAAPFDACAAVLTS
jgi:hypothetical protein